jgi:hypothetical protein
MGPAWVPFGPDFSPFPEASLSPSATAHQQEALEGPVLDLVYIGLIIVVFAALFLLIKGVERFER